MEKQFKNNDMDDNSIEEDEEEIYEMIDSKFGNIPSGNQNTNFAMPKPKLRDFSPIDTTQYFPNHEFIGDIPIYWKGQNGPILLCLHGAGHSAMSFAHLSKSIKNKYKLVSFDFRGHGFNKNQSSADLSQATLIADTLEVIKYLDEKFPDDTMIIMGHSMGGSIATKTTAEILKNENNPEAEIYRKLTKKICGLIVIDVVEGSAIDALPFMESIVRQRPKVFKTIDAGIEYMYKSGTIKNMESARMSVPSLLYETKDDKNNNAIVYKWRTDLLASQKYWTEWFTGLTKCFLSIKIPKILLLASSDRMDKELTIAQMQGKFRLAIINDVGHIIHEDDSKEVEKMIADFISIFKIASRISEMKPIIGKLGTSNSTFKKYEEFK